MKVKESKHHTETIKQGHVALKVFTKHTKNLEVALIPCEILNNSYSLKIKRYIKYIYIYIYIYIVSPILGKDNFLYTR